MHYYTQYNDCLVLNKYNETSCSDTRTGYVNCANYTLQAYAYCGCYYALPDQLYTCANVQLQIRPNKPAATTSLATGTTDYVGSGFLTGPISPSSTGQSLLSFFNPTASPTTVGIVTSTTDSQGSLVATTTFPSITHTFTPIPVVNSGTPSGTTNTPVLVADTSGSAGLSSTTSTATMPVIYGSGTLSSGTMSTLPTTTMFANHPSSSSSSASSSSSSSSPSTGPPHPTTATYTSVGTSTGISTITSCPTTLYSCPAGYSSEETYTTKYTSTYYSCEGGCDGVAGAPTGYIATAGGSEDREVCVKRLRKRVFVGGREL